ncbi:hypothetical protein EV421DRAFT_243901 [Armillaria borealis]|uniref:Uncharacterized protein n=1 Tax=Armillaria borealis TaxID=47425 RepID=A0AA39IUM4_9AGAR|nr:hypothetical protein EV421DRAFT_243901 [Armillaria borealis]
MFVPMDREDAERRPVDIDPNNIHGNPIGFSWYTGSEGGGFVIPKAFKKYNSRCINDTPMGYLHFLVKKSRQSDYSLWLTRYADLFSAINLYIEGLKEYAKREYSSFVVPFGRKHRGKRLDQCSDEEWMLWTMNQPILTDKWTVYFTAVDYFLENPELEYDPTSERVEYVNDLDPRFEDDDEEKEFNDTYDTNDGFVQSDSEPLLVESDYDPAKDHIFNREQLFVSGNSYQGASKDSRTSGFGSKRKRAVSTSESEAEDSSGSSALEADDGHGECQIFCTVRSMIKSTTVSDSQVEETIEKATASKKSVSGRKIVAKKRKRSSHKKTFVVENIELDGSDEYVPSDTEDTPDVTPTRVLRSMSKAGGHH